MSDDPQAPVTEEVDGSAEPTQEAQPPESPAEPEHDFERRYKDTHTAMQKAMDEARELREILENPEKHYAYIEENRPEWFEDGAPVEETAVTTNEPADPRVEELVQWRQQQDQLRYEQDLEKALDGRELDAFGAAYLAQQIQENGWTPDTVEKAIKDYFGHLESKATPAPAKPSAPHVPTGGAAPDGPDTPPAEMTPSQYAKWAAEQLRAEAA